MKIANSDSKGSGLLQRCNSPALPLLITALLYCALIFVTVRDRGYDFSYFVTAGYNFSEAAKVPTSLTVGKTGDGYDGQFYYRLALDPFTSKVTDFGVRLDDPAYRQQRILYPLIVWSLSFGRIANVPALLVAVNFLGLCALAWLGAVFVRSVGLHSLWGLAFPFYPGFLLTLQRDLTEILCAAFLLASLLCVRRRRYFPATVLLILAILTRETAILVAAGVALAWLTGIWDGKGAIRTPWYVSGFALLAYAIWQIVLLRNWGYRLWNEAHAGDAGHALGLPFAGFLSRLVFYAGSSTQADRVMFFDMLLIVVFVAAVVWVMRSSAASRLEKTVWLLYAALAFLLTPKIWVEDWAFLRALSEFYLFGTIILLLSQSKMKILMVASWGTLWLSYFLRFTNITDRVLDRLTRL